MCLLLLLLLSAELPASTFHALRSLIFPALPIRNPHAGSLKKFRMEDLRAWGWRKNQVSLLIIYAYIITILKSPLEFFYF
jgi:hypothetical protein